MRRILVMMLSLASSLMMIGPALGQTPEPTPAHSADPVIVAVGDIAACSSPGDEQTAALVDNIPGTILAVGDIAYEHGSAQEFASCYGPSWGRFKKRTRPAPGNHDYVTPFANGYYDYFGSLAGSPHPGYFTFNFCAWVIISLDSKSKSRAICTSSHN